MSGRKTPLIQKLRAKGGTLYVFPSANEDIGLNLNSDTNGVALSHYALLNLPEIKDSSLAPNSQVSMPTGVTPSQALAMSLQNYMMNFETLLVNQDTYNYKELYTVSEKVFWHWMKATGLIKTTGNITEALYGDGNYYYEGGSYNVSRNIDNDQLIHSTNVHDEYVVQCFGAIDAGNSLSTEFGMFNETYINIPTSYGGGPVFFKASEDANYKYKKYKLNSQVQLEGRIDDANYTSYLPVNNPYMDETGFYNTVRSSDNFFEGIEIVKDINTIQKILRKELDDETIVVSSYDDLNVDVKKKFDVDTEFDFNAILLYYSVYDKNDAVKTAYATNLFGIIFLDGPVSNDDNSFYLPPYTKIKSSEQQFGNSFSFRVNIKTMSVYDNTDAIIQDNTTMSSIASNDFSDVVSQLNRAIDIMNVNVRCTQQIQDQYADIVSYYEKQSTDIQNISNQVDSYVSGQTSTIVNTSTLFANSIYPNTQNTENNITFSVRDSGVDADGNIAYVQPPVMTIDETGVHANTIYNTNLYTGSVYVKGDNGVSSSQDYNERDENLIKAVNNGIPHDVNYNNDVLKLMFDQSTNMVVKLKYDYDYSVNNSEYHNKVWNQLYISADSPLFEPAATYGGVSYLKDQESGSVDYIGLVPYIVAQLQKISGQFTYAFNAAAVPRTLKDIHSVTDALNYLLNLNGESNIESLIASLSLVSNATSVYRDIAGNEITSLTNVITAYYFAGQISKPVIQWYAADPNMEGPAKTTSFKSLTLEYTPAGGGASKSVNLMELINGGTTYNSTTDKIAVSKPAEDNVTGYIGSQLSYTDTPATSITVSLTAESTYKEEATGKMPNPATKTITLTQMTKCYYWYSDNGNVSAQSITKTTIGGKALAQLGSFTDAQLNAGMTVATKDFPSLSGHANGYYVYFAIPEANLDEAIHTFVNIDFGPGGLQQLSSTSYTFHEFNSDVPGYYIYRTNQMQTAAINIKL